MPTTKKNTAATAVIFRVFKKDKYLSLFTLVALVSTGYFWIRLGVTRYLFVLLALWLVFIIFFYFKRALFSLNIFLAVFVVLTVTSILFIFDSVPGLPITNRAESNQASTAGTSPATKTATAEVLPETTFVDGLGQWYEHVWYKPASSGGEVTTGSDGVTFKAVQSNSRSGIMLDLNKDVSSFKKLTIEAQVTAVSQTLTGTGWNGREAPVAIAVSYQDVDGGNHNLLGEDPSAPLQMFWRGFYYLDPTVSSDAVNGVKVTQNQPYTFSYDLMNLSPKPKVITFVGIEGAGWRSREGSVSAISITGE